MQYISQVIDPFINNILIYIVYLLEVNIQVSLHHKMNQLSSNLDQVTPWYIDIYYCLVIVEHDGQSDAMAFLD